MPTNGEHIVKVSEKGAISLYGLRRFPITFYYDEWKTLGELLPKILKYGKAHESELKDKAEGKGIEGGTKL